MSKNKWEIFPTYFPLVDFEVLILKVPEDEIEDKLAQHVREQGRITKSFYEDFIIVLCLANFNALYLHSKTKKRSEMNEFREKLLEHIYRLNPLLNPINLYINKNNLIKVKADHELGNDERMLVDNKYWNMSGQQAYDDGNVDDLKTEGNKTHLEIIKEKNIKLREIKDINKLETKTIQKWWDRIQDYVNIRVFKEEDAYSLLYKKNFWNLESFRSYVIFLCIEDYDELFNFMEETGVTKNITAIKVMSELYELCRQCNPLFSYSVAKEFMSTEDNQNQNNNRQNRQGTKANSATSMKQYVQQQQNKELFKDVPKKVLLGLSDKMNMYVIGQNEAVNEICSSVKRASVGLKSPDRPIGSFLFAGRTGIGKTLTCKVLARELVRNKENITIIDCSEYTQDHEYAKLIGSPPGYIGHDDGGRLTNSVMNNPFQVVVFDEVEKASTKVHGLLLQIMDEGRLTDGKGRIVDFRNTVVIMTSNIGVSEVDNVKKKVGFGDVAVLTEDKKEKAINEAIKKHFRPEFINRIDRIVSFKSLTDDDFMKIIDIELDMLNQNLKDNDTEYRNMEIEFDTSVKKYIFKKGISEEFGARPLKREIEKEISTLLADVLLNQNISVDSKVNVYVDDDEVCFEFMESDIISDKEYIRSMSE